MEKDERAQRTLVIFKPDAVERGMNVIGAILIRFGMVGLRLVGLKMVAKATKKQLDLHFSIEDEKWIRSMGEKSLENYAKFQMDPMKKLGTNDPLEIGKIILGWNYDYLISGPIVVTVLEGQGAISVVRKIIGPTDPASALPGTIRGDFSCSSIEESNLKKTSCKNVVHASGNEKEAGREIRAWFQKEELID